MNGYKKHVVGVLKGGYYQIGETLIKKKEYDNEAPIGFTLNFFFDENGIKFSVHVEKIKYKISTLKEELNFKGKRKKIKKRKSNN
jgi:hypothetical protein